MSKIKYAVIVAAGVNRASNQAPSVRIDVCDIFEDLWYAENAYNTYLSQLFARYDGEGYEFNNYDKHCCDIYFDNVSYRIELKEV